MAKNPRFEMYSTRSDGSNLPKSSTLSYGENFLLSQGVLWDKQSMGDQTCHCYPKLKRVTNAVVGTVAGNPSLGPLQAKPLSSLGVEELKQPGSCITENDPKTRREWLNTLNEAPYALDRYHRSILPRKRSHIEPSTPVLDTQVQIRNESAEVEWCPNNMPRSSELISREGYISMPEICFKNMPNQSRHMSSFGKPASLIKDYDQTLFAGKAKMAGRCYGMMPDVSVEAVAKMIDGDRDYEHVIQKRSSTECYSRPSESHGFRSNIYNGRASQPSRFKSETISSLSPFPESKESSAGNKCKSKIKKSGYANAKIARAGQDFGDGVRRPGSSGRVSSLLRMNAPLSRELENPRTTKQPRSTMLGNVKVARKTFRQFINKTLMDQKSIARKRSLMNSGLSDFTGVLDDREEHPEAVNVCNNASGVLDDRKEHPATLNVSNYASGVLDDREEHPAAINVSNNASGVVDDREEHPAAVNVSNYASDVACSEPLWKIEEENVILINPPGNCRTGEAYLISSNP